MRRHRRRAIDPLRRLLEVFLLGFVNIDKHLRVSIHQWKPRALHLNHDAMPGAEGMAAIVQSELDGLRLIGHEWSGLFETSAVAAAHDVAAHELLVTAHAHFSVWFRIRIV